MVKFTSHEEEEQACAGASGDQEACVGAPCPADVDVEQEETGIRMFGATASRFHDWFHRRFFLQGMNFHTHTHVDYI